MQYKKRLLAVFCFAVFTGCGAGSELEIAEIQPPLTDILTFELSFGDAGTQDEFLLARPYSFVVNSRDEILVVDEDYVKVFDSNGTGLTRFGGNGNGPGEFNRVRSILLSPDDYISVSGALMANYFKPDFSYIDRINFRNERPFKEILELNDLIFQRPEFVFNISETEHVYTIGAMDKDRNNRDHSEILLFYDSQDTIITLARYTQSNYIVGPSMSRAMGNLGMLLVEILPGNRIIFTHTYHDSEINETKSTYTLTILSLDTFKKTYITHPYTPVAIEWEPLEYPDDYRERNPEQYKQAQEMNEITEKFIAERKYQSTLFRIAVDGEFIFAFTAFSGDASETIVDIFDGSTGKYLRSALFPVSYMSQIRNGYLYKVNNYFQTDDFPKIEKFKIDPAVYKK